MQFFKTFESQKKLNYEKNYLSFCHDPLKKHGHLVLESQKIWLNFENVTSPCMDQPLVKSTTF